MTVFVHPSSHLSLCVFTPPPPPPSLCLCVTYLAIYLIVFYCNFFFFGFLKKFNPSFNLYIPLSICILSPLCLSLPLPVCLSTCLSLSLSFFAIVISHKSIFLAGTNLTFSRLHLPSASKSTTSLSLSLSLSLCFTLLPPIAFIFPIHVNSYHILGYLNCFPCLDPQTKPPRPPQVI